MRIGLAAETLRVSKKKELSMSTLQKPLHIDIPVKIADIKVAFSVAALAFEGDLPASMS